MSRTAPGPGRARWLRNLGRGGVLALACLSTSHLGHPVALAGGGDDVPVRIVTEAVVEGVDEPVFLTHAGDGSGDLYVVEKAGRIRVVDEGTTLEPEPFLDISDRTKSDGYEQGLLGLAFHPDYPKDPRFYVDYTRVPDGATVISEFRGRGERADPAPERILLVVPQPAPSHNAGMLAFDAGGGLLASLGDGGFGDDHGRNAQDPASLLGKIIRIDVEAGVRPGPTPAGPSSHVVPPPEILAMGLRNPWRFSIDPVLGHIYIGDVGQFGWEEIDVLPAGAPVLNFGWKELEGPQCGPIETCDPAAHTPPVIAYHRDPSGAVIGGYAYRGSAQPLLEGLYVYADHWGPIFAAPLERMLGGAAVPVQVGTMPVPGTTSLGEDEEGELYAVGPAGVHRLVAEPRDAPEAPGLVDLPQAPLVRSPDIDIGYVVMREATGSARDPMPLEALYSSDLDLRERGRCLVAHATGDDPFVGLSIPAGAALRLRSAASGLLQVFLQVGDTLSEEQSIRRDVSEAAVEVFMAPRPGVESVVLRVDPPVGTRTRLCLVSMRRDEG